MWSTLVPQLINSGDVIPWPELEKACRAEVSAAEESAYLDVVKMVLMKLSDIRYSETLVVLESMVRKHRLAVLNTLCSLLSKEKDACLKQDTLVHLMIRFVYARNHMETILNRIAGSTNNLSDIESNNTINMLINLPSLVANVTQKRTAQKLLPLYYYPRLCEAIYGHLKWVYERLQQGKDTTLAYTTKLLGRIAASGYSSAYREKILEPLMENSFDLLWQRIANRLIVGQNDRCLEYVLRPVFYAERWQVCDRLLKDAIKRDKISFLICNKFLLVHTDTTQFLNNILYYVHSRSPDYFRTTVKSLLDVWSNASGVRHRSVSQHMYICSALVLCVKIIKGTAKVADFQLPDALIYGIEVYLNCANLDIRFTGLYVGQLITTLINGPELDLKIERTPEVKQLEDLYKSTSNNNTEIVKPKPAPAATPVKQTSDKKIDDNDTDDDDDDLRPYDMSHDVPLDQTKKPLYLRDCINGLRDTEKPEWLQTCLECCEDLIRKNSAMLEDIAEELAKVLLYLQDEYELPNFGGLRRNALVTLCFHAPIPVSQFLTAQFYDRSHVIRRRLDILEVLSITSERLANPNETGQFVDGIPLEVILAEKKWHAIMERIDPKTKVISKPRVTGSYVNKFAPVAGYFFFPLMKNFDRPDITFNLMGEDYYLLGRLLYSLGIMLYSAAQAPIAVRMGSALLQFIWNFRYHAESFVRQALIFCICTILSSVPAVSLLDRFHNDLIELKEWLLLVAEKDTSEECTGRAYQSLVLLKTLIEQNVK